MSGAERRSGRRGRKKKLGKMLESVLRDGVQLLNARMCLCKCVEIIKANKIGHDI